MVYLSKCCNPIRGEPIVGYITRGKGVSVHTIDCESLESFQEMGQKAGMASIYGNLGNMYQTRGDLDKAVEEILKGYLDKSLYPNVRLDAVGKDHGRISPAHQGLTIKGRLDGTIPHDGELDPNLVAIALGHKNKSWAAVPETVVLRPPEL